MTLFPLLFLGALNPSYSRLLIFCLGDILLHVLDHLTVQLTVKRVKVPVFVRDGPERFFGLRLKLPQ